MVELRGLDQAIFNDCIAVLRLDYRCKMEVHRYFEDGSRRWEQMFQRWSLHEEQLERAHDLVKSAAEAERAKG